MWSICQVLLQRYLICSYLLFIATLHEAEAQQCELLKNIVKQAMQQEFEFVTFRLEEITQYFTVFYQRVV